MRFALFRATVAGLAAEVCSKQKHRLNYNSASNNFDASFMLACRSGEGLEYWLVATFPAYGFATLVPHNENLNSPKQVWPDGS